MKTSPIWDAVAYREELSQLSTGFTAKEEEFGKKWCIYFKLSNNSKAETIKRHLTQKQAEKKAEALNLIISQ
jgi:hypothetical protein